MVMMTAPMTLMMTTMVTVMLTMMVTRMVTMGHATCQPGCHQSWHVSKLAWHWFPIASAIIIIIEISWSNITTVYIWDVTRFVPWRMYSYSKRYFFLQNQVHGSGKAGKEVVPGTYKGDWYFSKRCFSNKNWKNVDDFRRSNIFAYCSLFHQALHW